MNKKNIDDQNWSFKYKDAEQNYAEVAIKPTTPKGVKFLKFIYVKVTDVIADFENPARAKTVDSTKVVEFQRLIKNNKYIGPFHIPPVITTKGVLLDGHHRFQAHRGENMEYMWVAVCECDDNVGIFNFRCNSNNSRRLCQP